MDSKTTDKKPTIGLLKNEIDKLKINFEEQLKNFENEKQEKNTKIDYILSVVENLGSSLSAYSNLDDDDEQEKTELKEIIEKQINDHLKSYKTVLDEELKKKETTWQQKYDIEIHRLTRQIDDLKISVPPTSFNPKKPLIIKFAPLSSFAQKPMRGSEFSAGIDLRSAYEYTVPANGNKLIKTDWKIEYPDGYFGKICSRSGLSLNHSIETGAGVIDADWSGGVSVVLNNLSGRDFHVSPGDRIAQLVCTPYITPDIIYCNPDDIVDTVRANNGFGSTGIK
jgi:dUTP pyrophosphatase